MIDSSSLKMSKEPLFEIDEWKAVEKDSRRSFDGSKYTLYHSCEFGKGDNCKWGFRYTSKHTDCCYFCKSSIPEEIIFLLEMTKK